MNHRKKTSNLGFPMLILLFVALSIVAAGGIGYVVMKNRQVTAQREIVKVQKRMDEHKVAITLYKSDIDSTLGVFNLRDELVERRSSLKPIDSRVVEVYQSNDQESPPEAVARR